MTEKQAKPTHADGAPADLPENEPSLAEKARTLVERGGHSSLSTISRKHAGYPFGSIMPYGISECGEPTFLISSMAMHTRNLLNNPRATLLIVQADGSTPLGSGRASLMGDVHAIESDNEIETVTGNYLARHPEAENWMHFGDFRFFKMTLLDVYFVGGFGVMGWISSADFLSAAPDPLAEFADGIIQHMNQDHREAMVAMAKAFQGLDATDAEITSVDRLGFNMRVTTKADGIKGARIAFPSPVSEIRGTREIFVELANLARQRTN